MFDSVVVDIVKVPCMVGFVADHMIPASMLPQTEWD